MYRCVRLQTNLAKLCLPYESISRQILLEFPKRHGATWNKIKPLYQQNSTTMTIYNQYFHIARCNLMYILLPRSFSATLLFPVIGVKLFLLEQITIRNFVIFMILLVSVDYRNSCLRWQCYSSLRYLTLIKFSWKAIRD